MSDPKTKDEILAERAIIAKLVHAAFCPNCEAAARERDAAYEDARQMQERLQRLINAEPDAEARLDRIDLLENRCRSLTAQAEAAIRDKAEAVGRAARELADLRARLTRAARLLDLVAENQMFAQPEFEQARAELREEAK